MATDCVKFYEPMIFGFTLLNSQATRSGLDCPCLDEKQSGENNESYSGD